MHKDPRDARYYSLYKRDLSQLGPGEIRELLITAEKMIGYVKEPKGRRSWNNYIDELKKELLSRQQ